jgi:toxin ParE1/3/4
MARKLRWTNAAVWDLDEAAAFIARDSRFYAVALVREARAASKTLTELAERGRRVPEAGRAEVREISVKSYRLIYEIKPEEVVVLAFVHGARDLKSILPGASK